MKRTKSRRAKLLIGVLIAASVITLMLTITVLIYLNPPKSFLANSTFIVESGSTIRDIADEAAEQGFVKSSLLLYLILANNYQPSDFYAGEYLFEHPVSVTGFANTISSKEAGQHLVKLTFPEGISAKTMSSIAKNVLPDFDSEMYLELASHHEGELFPETYLVSKSFSAADLINLQLKTYEEQLSHLSENFEVSSLSKPEVIILASIVEREANDETSMRTVAGIYLNRLKLGMPLQADASVEYVLDKKLEELVPEDLKIDSPYNTYLNTGLPPTAIGNPGLMAIKAVLDPIESDYYYYLTAPDGTFYYAKTFDQHTANIERYLR